MYYIIQILGAILIGISVAALLGTRTVFVVLGSILAIAFGIGTMVVPGWWVLWGGVACFIVGQIFHRDGYSRATA